MKDFVDVIAPALAAGTFTNFGTTTQIVGKGTNYKASIRGNQKWRVEVENDVGGGDPVLTFDGAIIQNNLRGIITVVHTDNTLRNKMKSDIMAILKSAGIPFTVSNIKDTPKVRNRKKASFLVQIIEC